jgi:hypothetical protein
MADALKEHVAGPAVVDEIRGFPRSVADLDGTEGQVLELVLCQPFLRDAVFEDCNLNRPTGTPDCVARSTSSSRLSAGQSSFWARRSPSSRRVFSSTHEMMTMAMQCSPFTARTSTNWCHSWAPDRCARLFLARPDCHQDAAQLLLKSGHSGLGTSRIRTVALGQRQYDPRHVVMPSELGDPLHEVAGRQIGLDLDAERKAIGDQSSNLTEIGLSSGVGVRVARRRGAIRRKLTPPLANSSAK